MKMLTTSYQYAAIAAAAAAAAAAIVTAAAAAACRQVIVRTHCGHLCAYLVQNRICPMDLPDEVWVLFGTGKH